MRSRSFRGIVFIWDHGVARFDDEDGIKRGLSLFRGTVLGKRKLREEARRRRRWLSSSSSSSSVAWWN